jgi:hypothetical protein
MRSSLKLTLTTDPYTKGWARPHTVPLLFCSVHTLHQTLPIDPMIKTIHRPSSAAHRIIDVIKVKLTARQHQDCESYMTYHGCSFSAAFNAKFVPIV